MKNFGYIVKRLREERGLTQEQLATASGVARSHVTRMENGDYKNLTNEMMGKIARGLQLSIAALSQEIYGNPNGGPLAPIRPPLGKGKVEIHQIPIYSDFPFHAGDPAEPAEYVYRELPREAASHIEGYAVRGTCLTPVVNDGDTIIVDRDRAIDNGDIVACMIDGELHIAKLKRYADELWLENNEGKRKLRECKQSAVVIEVVRRLK